MTPFERRLAILLAVLLGTFVAIVTFALAGI